MAMITISREFGSRGEEIAWLTAEKLNFLRVNKKMIEEGLLNQLSQENKLVILESGGHLLFKNHSPALHVRIICPREKRILRVKETYSLSDKAAAALIRQKDRDIQKYIEEIFNEDWSNLDLYDLIINTDKITIESASEIIANSFLIKEKCKNTTTPYQKEDSGTKIELSSKAKKEIKFMHPSEKEFAKMLDFYRIKWEYEPKTFPLGWDSEGNITEAFSPDFYLPDYDLYVEITTQRQKLVWKKNKKVRRLKEFYPEINIKIIYNKDFKSLLRKFGLESG
ncbi:cytidylate kinase family protein [Candidatus Contubernalis alkaliaceticus]|uniref:cytidylate kinase family protein n=1 Tax=Candidatus Contubernalis alkaliaceticus TaxID=338645 RepID=UPI001F4C3A10|nr:cytidylate kinase family protein [Candidatus Contubernalis alkalaceticus]UNC92689.1 cytidylate kinase-like family protein [Candidatus Contubernalis alkalaceticus]